jgi:3',5'-cyclic AMP phosphodiesterase CpdA
MKIAALSDIHFGTLGSEEWCYEAAPEKLRQAVSRINRDLQPDVTGPWFAIRGNHDVPAEAFHAVFPPPPDFLDLAGGRLLAFPRDPDEPEYRSSRNPSELKRLAKARENFSGPLVAVQHVPVVPPELALARYNYINAEEILAAMQDADVGLSLSGHDHKGFPLTRHEGTWLCAIPPFCQPPHAVACIRYQLSEKPVVTVVAERD